MDVDEMIEVAGHGGERGGFGESGSREGLRFGTGRFVG
jgi:hypothetical protein